MISRLTNQIQFWLPPILIAVAVLCTWYFFERFSTRQQVEEARRSVNFQLSTLRAELERNIHINASRVEGMVIAISLEPNMSLERYSSLAAPLIVNYPQLRNIGAAPDLVVRYMYPVLGNEAIIGMDYRDIPQQVDAALQAMEAGELVLAGPVNLLQGGQGLIGRIPVFLHGSDDVFWGLLSVVIDLDEFYRASGLVQEDISLRIAIRGKDAQGPQGEIFYGLQEVFDSDPVLASVSLPYGSWQMAAIPDQGWPTRASNAWLIRFIFFSGGIALVLPVAVVCHLLVLRRENLKQLHQSFEDQRQTAREAQAANIAKSEFLANMSHELRTPFNGIMGMMQLLQTTPLNDEQQKFVAAAIQSSGRFTRLLSDILDLSSIEAGRMCICATEFRLDETVESVMELFALRAREKGITMERSLDPDMPGTVVGDAVRIKQILFNLVGNALKFTEKGKVSIHLSALSAAKGGDVRVMFSITDTGIGIPDEKFQDLFQPFSQVDGSYTRAHQGAGLGLVIVRRLVALMGGNIDVESLVGQGTTVHVVLPFALPVGGDSEHDAAASFTGETKKHLNILLAEDDPLNQLFMRSILEKLGHVVTLANNGQEAIDFLEHNDFDSILMDIQMPVMTGDEATKAIRESTSLGGKRNIPIIAVTAHTQPGDRERFLAAGMDDYLGKPVGVDDLKKMLAKHAGL